MFFNAELMTTADRRRDLIHHLLCLPTPAVTYHAGAALADLHPDKAILFTSDHDFDLLEYAKSGACAVWPNPDLYSHFASYWDCRDQAHYSQPCNAWLVVEWQGLQLDVLLLGCRCDPYYWIIAESPGQAEAFFSAVCAWCTRVEPQREILVFEHGGWRKNEALCESIRSASMENLVLPGGLKHALREDIAGFFEASELYKRYGVPWKRGILLVGPPGNGKTHAIKALANTLDKPCLYVKSLHAERGGEHHSLRVIFQRAREAAPCLLILEDLDSLIDDGNRSFFLNELDGFAENWGVLTLATTNHPQRLDPAIVDRPSRFDRKYHFSLPDHEARHAYLEHWNSGLHQALTLAQDALQAAAEQTHGFSFAYLKELMRSTLMAWIGQGERGDVAAVLREQIALLRAQMVSS